MSQSSEGAHHCRGNHLCCPAALADPTTSFWIPARQSMKGNPVSAHSLAELLADRRHQLASRVSMPSRKWPLAPGADAAWSLHETPDQVPLAEHVVCFRPLHLGTVVIVDNCRGVYRRLSGDLWLLVTPQEVCVGHSDQSPLDVGGDYRSWRHSGPGGRVGVRAMLCCFWLFSAERNYLHLTQSHLCSLKPTRKVSSLDPTFLAASARQTVTV